MTADKNTCPNCAKDFKMLQVPLPSLTVGSTAPQLDHTPDPVGRAQGVSVELPPLRYEIPKDIFSILSGGGSALGLSAISEYLGCPEKARLRRIGVRQKRSAWALDGLVDLTGDPLGFGSVMHALRATRLFHGMGAAFWFLKQLEIDEDSRMKANNLLRTYEREFNLAEDPWEYLGVETEIRADMNGAHGAMRAQKPILRSVRYDAIVRMRGGGEIFSFELKTASRSGTGTINQYAPQRYAHAAIWNANPHLVAKYGSMRGTIYDLMIKTEVPKCERAGPFYVSRWQQQLATAYLALPDRLRFEANHDGTHSRMLHSCWGKYRPCEYINLCHEQAFGDYEQEGN